MASSQLTQALNALNIAVDAVGDDATISLEELAHARATLFTVVSRINQHHNRLTPISKLPPEILGRIFDFVVAPGRNILEPCPNYSAQAHSLTLVCKSWRTTALDWPRMWYNIIDTDMVWSNIPSPKTVFGRSGAAPLHIYSQIPSARRSLFPHIYGSHPHRIREAHLHIDEDQPMEVILKSLASPMPNLEFLDIHVSHRYTDYNDDPGMPVILGGPSTSLRAFALRQMSFVPGNSFPNLVHLRLDTMTCDIRRFLRLLRNCPRLETFEHTEPTALLPGASSGSDFEPVSGDDKPTLSPVVLPHLRGLRMGYMNVEYALAILALLKLPRHPVMRLDNLERSAGHYPVRQFLTKPPLSTLYNIKGLTHLDIIHMAEYGNVHFISHGQNRGIWLHVHATVFVNSDFSHLVAHVDTRDITTFRLSILPNAVGCLSFLRSMLVKMPSLSRLLVKCEQRLTPLSGQALLKEVAEALTPSSSSSNDGSPAEIPAPGLNSLGIEIGLIQDYRCHPGLAGAAINRQKVPLDAVVRMAASRKRSAHPIRSLVCNISGCTREDLLPLSKFVSEFDVATGPLFVAGRYVPSAFKMKNDYWELFRSDDGMTSWDMPEESY